jgi:hypothetical protein
MSIIPLPANALATCGEGSDGNQKREKPNRTQMRPKTTLCYRTPGILWQLKSAHNTRGQQKKLLFVTFLYPKNETEPLSSKQQC